MANDAHSRKRKDSFTSFVLFSNVFWSGANNPLWYIQDGELKEIKADKQPIGTTDYPKPFTMHQIDYKTNTTFYLFTDGLANLKTVYI